MFRDVESQLTLAEILPPNRYHKEGGKIIHELLKNGSISSKAYFDLVGREAGTKVA